MSKVVCQACGVSLHNLKPHFKGQADDATCLCSIDEYLTNYPGFPLTSVEFDEGMARMMGRNYTEEEKLGMLDQKVFMFDSKALFGVEFGADNKVYGFSERLHYVPEVNKHFRFDQATTKLILIALAYNKPTLITGPTGCGKSEHVLQIAARLNYPVMRVNHNADMYSHDIVGKLDAVNGETVFTPGPLPFAMPNPMILLMDEWDAINAEVGFIYHPVLEQKTSGTLGDLVLGQDGGRVVRSHPLFRMFATSNTGGMGDEGGLYQGTQTQNYAQINRFLIKVAMGYPSIQDDIKILLENHPSLSGEEAKAFAETANKARKRYTAGEISVPLSTRDIISWAHLYLILGDPLDSLRFSCTNGLSAVDSKTIYEIAQRIFGGYAGPPKKRKFDHNIDEAPF